MSILHPRCRTARLVALLAAALAARAAQAGTDDVPAKARALADEGRAAHTAGDYPRAIAAFEAAYVIAPSGALLFNLAQDYRLSGDCDDAVLMYKRFLATDPDPQTQALAREHLAAVEQCAHHPDPRKVVAQASYTGVALPRLPPPQKLDDPTAAHTTLELGLAIAGSAALGVALVYGVDAHSAAKDVETFYAHGGTWKQIAATDARGHRDVEIAAVLGIGGALAIGSAAALYLYDHHHKERAQIAVAPDPRGGAHAGVTWHF